MHVNSYEEWLETVPTIITKGPVWRFWGYRKALFLYDLTWADCDKLRTDPKGKPVMNQLIRSAGSISANMEEGYGRNLKNGQEYAYFLRVALGSARETQGWYWRGRQLLPKSVITHRLALLDEIISLTINQIKRYGRKDRG